MTIRAAKESDYCEIARIQANCPEAAQWPVGDYSGFSVLLALLDGIPAGFCAWRQTSPEEAELLNLAVEPRLRRQGVASALLSALRGAATGEIFLEAAEPNHPAIALYRAMEWEMAGIRRAYYPGGIDAVVMKKSSC